jgi:uncharacterized repeat protein (TIGR03803 family)
MTGDLLSLGTGDRKREPVFKPRNSFESYAHETIKPRERRCVAAGEKLVFDCQPRDDEGTMLKIGGTITAILLSATVAVGAFAPAAQAKSSFKVVHAFAGTPSDGDLPMADVTFDNDGNLYGTTYIGGTANKGTIFKIDVHGTETLLHSFDGAAGGGFVAAGVTLDDSTGDLYGVTKVGGTFGQGLLYRLAADGTFFALHAFDNAHDGTAPQWRMIRDAQGNLYGVAPSGGTGGKGTLFEYSKDGVFSVLHNFDSSASSPTGRLAQDKKGNFYGVDTYGGTSTNCGAGCGAVYKLAPNGTFTVLYSFTDGADGRYPVGGLTIDKKGNLYGTAGYGGTGEAGTVFEESAKGKFTTLYSFNTNSGRNSSGEVLMIKKDLYVTALTGGANNLGTVIKISKGVGTQLHVFDADGGGEPVAGLVQHNALLYGTASIHGANNHGTVFSLKTK